MLVLIFFFFNDTATTEIYTLSLHDALPIFTSTVPVVGCKTPEIILRRVLLPAPLRPRMPRVVPGSTSRFTSSRSEEHTSELQSRQYLVCRLLLEKKKTNISIVDQRPLRYRY